MTDEQLVAEAFDFLRQTCTEPLTHVSTSYLGASTWRVIFQVGGRRFGRLKVIVCETESGPTCSLEPASPGVRM